MTGDVQCCEVAFEGWCTNALDPVRNQTFDSVGFEGCLDREQCFGLTAQKALIIKGNGEIEFRQRNVEAAVRHSRRFADRIPDCGAHNGLAFGFALCCANSGYHDFARRYERLKQSCDVIPGHLNRIG